MVSCLHFIFISLTSFYCSYFLLHNDKVFAFSYPFQLRPRNHMAKSCLILISMFIWFITTIYVDITLQISPECESLFRRNHLPFYSCWSVLPRMSSWLLGPLIRIHHSGNSKPDWGCCAHLEAETPEMPSNSCEYWKVILGRKGQRLCQWHRKKQASSTSGWYPLTEPKDTVPWPPTDRSGHEQDSVQQGISPKRFIIFAWKERKDSWSGQAPCLPFLTFHFDIKKYDHKYWNHRID